MLPCSRNGWPRPGSSGATSISASRDHFSGDHGGRCDIDLPVSSARFIVSSMASSSLHRRCGLPSSKDCRSDGTKPLLDMGIWHISMVLSQILGPAVTGWVISAVKASFGDPTAYATAFGIGALWLMLSAALVTCVRLPLLETKSERRSSSGTSGLIHSDDSQIGRSSPSSHYESRNCRQRHASRSPPA